MKFLESLIPSKNGTYIGIRPDIISCQHIRALAKLAKLSNPIQMSDIHATLVYDEDKSLPDSYYQTQRDYYSNPIVATPVKIERWNQTVVLLLESDGLVNRWKELHREFEFKWDWDEYKPHITLSYNDVDTDISSIRIPKSLDIILFVHEYYEPLKVDWEKEKT